MSWLLVMGCGAVETHVTPPPTPRAVEMLASCPPRFMSELASRALPLAPPDPSLSEHHSKKVLVRGKLGTLCVGGRILQGCPSVLTLSGVRLHAQDPVWRARFNCGYDPDSAAYAECRLLVGRNAIGYGTLLVAQESDAVVVFASGPTAEVRLVDAELCLIPEQGRK